MIELPDVSVLVALMDTLHVHHQRAKQWFDTASRTGWATCPLTQSGAVRVISRPQKLPAQDVTIPEAAQLLINLIQANATHHPVWQDEVLILNAQMFDLSKLKGYRQITDLHLLGIALMNGGTLVTMDTGLPQTMLAVRNAPSQLLRLLS